jgi:hypothetical protein
VRARYLPETASLAIHPSTHRHINPRTKKQSEERAASPTRASPSHAAALAVTLCRDSQPTQSEIQKVGPPVRPMCSSLADNRRALQNCLTLRNFPGPQDQGPCRDSEPHWRRGGFGNLGFRCTPAGLGTESVELHLHSWIAQQPFARPGFPNGGRDGLKVRGRRMERQNLLRFVGFQELCHAAQIASRPDRAVKEGV